MFTGIIETTARVQECTSSGLIVERPKDFTDLRVGSSIAVSGACLTVVKLTQKSMVFDVVEETLKRTTLGNLKKGDWINLERALKVGSRFEGHIVQGHIDGVGKVVKVMNVMQGVEVTITYPPSLRGLIVEKGSIAVDGVSLTVIHVTKDEFSVALIPHTLQETTLGDLAKNDPVNLEADILVKCMRASEF